MENVILLIHLLLALALIGVVLLQRSEGGGLGMGGGGGNVSTGRAAGTALGKLTWFLGLSIFATTLILTVIAAQNAGSGSVLDRVTDDVPVRSAPEPLLPGGADSLLPPAAGDDSPLVPLAE
ncbi:MAG: preprotein translocase subunit SecG [Pseudomonadota bacterium]